MKLKVYSYGNKVLHQEGEWVEENHEGLEELIDNMFETMEDAGGLGLAAQQIGEPLKLFVVDLTDIGDQSVPDFKKVFINSEIIEEGEDMQEFNEGCLSFPGLSLMIKRPSKIKMYYQDENFNEYEEWFGGLEAIVLQHEHDHVNGKTFITHIKPLRRHLIKSKLNDIKRGKIHTNYSIKLQGK